MLILFKCFTSQFGNFFWQFCFTNSPKRSRKYEAVWSISRTKAGFVGMIQMKGVKKKTAGEWLVENRPALTFFLSPTIHRSSVRRPLKNVLPLNRREPQASAKCKRSSIVPVCHCVMYDHTHTMHIYTQSYAYIHMCMTANIYIYIIQNLRTNNISSVFMDMLP